MKNVFFVIVCWLIFLFPSMPATAQEDGGPARAVEDDPESQLSYHLVVTANRRETPREEVGSSMTVITARQLEAMGRTTVLEALRSVPSLDVVQAGGAGGQTSVFIRGAKTEQTLVLWDGVELNDPSTPGRSVDLAHLTTAGIERIEIIRGPQSVLYGSDAMGGIINIISKTGKGRLSGFLLGEYGSLRSVTGRAALSGGGRRGDFALGVSRSATGGISAASAADGNEERDGWESTAVSARLGLKAAPGLRADLVLRYGDGRTDLDNAGGAGGDDPNHTGRSQQLFSRAQARLSLFGGRWEQTLGFSLCLQERRYRNDVDAAHPLDREESSFAGRSLRFDWQHDLRLVRGHALTAGLEGEEERGESDYHSESAWGPYDSRFAPRTARTVAAYAQDHVRLADGWYATLGVRLDRHSRFGGRATFRVASSYAARATGTRFRASCGSGFKAPSLYQLYSLYGNEDLRPETSVGWDIGVEQPLLGERLTLAATYFRNDFSRLIDFDGGLWKYVNVGAARSAGLELQASARPFAALFLQAGYTFMETEDRASGEDLPRRARHKLGLAASCRLGWKGSVGLDVQYVGRRSDVDYSAWPAARVALGGYLLVNLALAYDISPRVRVGAGVKNLGNAKYEEILGYGTPGTTASAGVTWRF